MRNIGPEKAAWIRSKDTSKANERQAVIKRLGNGLNDLRTSEISEPFGQCFDAFERDGRTASRPTN